MTTLRTANNSATDVVVMNAMKVIIPGYPVANTQLSYLNIFVQDTDSLQLPTTTFPALNIQAGAQKHYRIGEEYEGLLQVKLTYYDRWETQRVKINQVWATIALDLERVMANLQSNDSLTAGGRAYLTSMAQFELSDYEGEVDSTTVPGITLVKRHLLAVCHILPYDV